MAGAVTLAEVLAAVDRDSRDALVLRVEDALEGYTAPEAFLVTAYFCAIAISRLPCGDTAELIADMPRILADVIRNELHDVVRQ